MLLNPSCAPQPTVETAVTTLATATPGVLPIPSCAQAQIPTTMLASGGAKPTAPTPWTVLRNRSISVPSFSTAQLRQRKTRCQCRAGHWGVRCPRTAIPTCRRCILCVSPHPNGDCRCDCWGCWGETDATLFEWQNAIQGSVAKPTDKIDRHTASHDSVTKLAGKIERHTTIHDSVAKPTEQNMLQFLQCCKTYWMTCRRNKLPKYNTTQRNDHSGAKPDERCVGVANTPKRCIAIANVKKSKHYLAVRCILGMSQADSRSPNPYDTNISKRRWEKEMQQWRTTLAKEAIGAEETMTRMPTIAWLGVPEWHLPTESARA